MLQFNFIQCRTRIKKLHDAVIYSNDLCHDLPADIRFFLPLPIKKRNGYYSI